MCLLLAISDLTDSPPLGLCRNPLKCFKETIAVMSLLKTCMTGRSPTPILKKKTLMFNKNCRRYKFTEKSRKSFQDRTGRSQLVSCKNMNRTGLITFYSRTFPVLFKDFQPIFKESIFTCTISHFSSYSKKKQFP